MTNMIATPLFENQLDRAAWIEGHAEYFTAVRGIGRTRIRTEFATKDEAIEAQPGDGRSLIYGVAPDGASEHLCNI